MSTTTATLPAQTLTVLTKPTPLTEAIQHLDQRTGHYTAVIAVPTEEMTGEHERGVDAFYDNLCNRLTTDSDAFSMTYQILGASPDGQTLYVRASNNLVEYLRADPEWATEQGIDLSDLPF